MPWLIVAEAGEIFSAKSGDGGGGGVWICADVPPPQPAVPAAANTAKTLSDVPRSPLRVALSRRLTARPRSQDRVAGDHACENRSGIKENQTRTMARGTAYGFVNIDTIEWTGSGRRRDCSRRPPTPPDVRFRIRRFLKRMQSAAEHPAGRRALYGRTKTWLHSCAHCRRSTKGRAHSWPTARRAQD